MKIPTRAGRAALSMAMLLTAGGSLSYIAAVKGTAQLSSVDIPKATSEVPASVTAARPIDPPPFIRDRQIRYSRAVDIPNPAFLAYQHAAYIANEVSSCGIRWSLLAAIGRIESDHGRYGGSSLRSDGRSDPGIYGIALDGTNGTARITDTDEGALDRDRQFDRAIGPMQFIPSTWKGVAVDGDNDGRKNPQDIDDAALAAIVYLCAGSADLSNEAGMRRAVLRYNHSEKYVDQVLALSRAYESSVGTSPLNVGAATPVIPAADQPTPGDRDPAKADNRTTSKPASKPAHPKPVPEEPVKSAEPPRPKPQPVDVVQETLTPLQEATVFCQSNLTGAQVNALGGLAACTGAFSKGGVDGVNRLLSGLTGSLKGLLGG